MSEELNGLLARIADEINLYLDGQEAPVPEPVPEPGVKLVQSSEELDVALRDAAEGAVIELRSGIYEPFVWSKSRGHSGYVTLRAQAGGEVVFRGPGVSSPSDVFRIEDIDQFQLIGLTFMDAQFGLRIFSSRHGRVRDCEVFSIGHAGVAVNDFSRLNSTGALTLGEPSAFIYFDNCHVHHTGRTCSAEQPYGEAFYFGHGGEPWKHTPHHLSVLGCDVHDTVGDGVDIKLGCHHVDIGWSTFHDMDTPSGAVISHGPHATPDPEPHVLKPISIFGNKMWNIGFGEHGTHAYGISAFAGGLSINRNVMWSFAYYKWNTRGINLRGLSPVTETYPVQVYQNRIWVDDSILITYTNGPAPAIKDLETNYTADGAAGSILVAPSDMVGPVPGLDERSFGASLSDPMEPGSALELL